MFYRVPIAVDMLFRRREIMKFIRWGAVSVAVVLVSITLVSIFALCMYVFFLIYLLLNLCLLKKTAENVECFKG